MKSKKQLHLTDELYFEPVVFLKDGNTPKFDNDVQYQELLARIDGLMQFFRNKNHAAPGIIVIDTGSRILEGEENSNTIISKVMNRCAELARTCKASVLILHHTSRSKNDPRGGSAWEGAADCVWLLSGSAKTGVTLNVQKFKGFILPPDLYFKVVPVETEFLDMDHTDGRKLMAARIERLMEKPAGSSKDKDAIGEKSAANLTRTPEQKHAKRQAERLDVLVCVWEDYCAKDLRNERPYITRSALGEYLSNVLGYKTGTINQAMKPSADSTKSASIIGPLLTDKLIEPCEHGWIILPTEAEQKATPPGEPRALPKRKVAKRKP
jgi:hypothetical protein